MNRFGAEIAGMKIYKITDSTGDVWGHITERSAQEAVEWLLDDIANNPDAYMGEPVGLKAEEI